MPVEPRRVLLAGRTPAERRRNRAGLRLRDFSITARTRARYELAVGRLVPYLEKQENLQCMDDTICEWIEAQWARGESVNFIADALSGLISTGRSFEAVSEKLGGYSSNGEG